MHAFINCSEGIMSGWSSGDMWSILKIGVEEEEIERGA
jgi:hypothetical protein